MPPHHHRHRPHRQVPVLRWLATGAAAFVAAYLGVTAGAAVSTYLDPASNGTRASRFVPPAGVEERSTRLRPAPVAPAGSGGWAATLIDPHTAQPVGFDPCRPIRLVVNPEGAPPGSRALVVKAFTDMAHRAGFEVVDAGTSTERPSVARDPYQPGRYGKRWAPVLIAWASPAQDPRLAGDTIGLGGSAPAAAGGGPLTYVTGQITLDRTQAGPLMKDPESRSQLAAAVAHEAGHVLGLAHVDDRNQLMYPDTNPDVSTPRDGDLRGLVAVGVGACRPDL